MEENRKELGASRDPFKKGGLHRTPPNSPDKEYFDESMEQSELGRKRKAKSPAGKRTKHRRYILVFVNNLT